jgi:hypothetical protein
MLIAEARVETDRFSRYLVQLCRHFNDEAHPEEQVHVEWSDDRGVASFGWGRCTLRAETPTRKTCSGSSTSSPTTGG